MTTDTQLTARQKRRWHQFSLRMLLIAMVVVSAAMAIGLRWIAPTQRQRAAVKMVEQLGGSVFYVDPPADEAWVVRKLRDWLPRDYFDDVTGVMFLSHSAQWLLTRLFRGHSMVVVDDDLRPISELKQLRTLVLSGMRVSDAGLVRLVELKQLEFLELDDTQVTDTGMAQLSELKQLKGLWLSNTRVTDAGLAHLSELPRLNGLVLDGTQVTDTGLNQLTRLRTLQAISLVRTCVTQSGVMEFQTSLPDCYILGPSLLGRCDCVTCTDESGNSATPSE